MIKKIIPDFKKSISYCIAKLLNFLLLLTSYVIIKIDFFMIIIELSLFHSLIVKFKYFNNTHAPLILQNLIFFNAF
ncbi:hypothetical protein EM308_17745 [Flavobacterium gilvum]|uniref:Uncharacterized protein n=1 Tax=Flavobacterium gilvum TaxID=1492737 RepID=A0AAC9I641_9FLAO|nr:hypothetical protein EM308_17745 [Flavobacterium gilvum]